MGALVDDSLRPSACFLFDVRHLRNHEERVGNRRQPEAKAKLHPKKALVDGNRN